MRPSRLAAAALAVLLAVVLALISADVRTWHDTLEAHDLRFRTDAQRAANWNASTLLPTGVTRTLLGIDDDLALRDGVARFRTVGRTGSQFDSGRARRRARASAESQLVTVISGGTGQFASHASNLLGILTFADATSGRRAATPVERSVAAFQEAIRLDPDNAAAKFNLELLFHLIEARGTRIGPGTAAGSRGGGQRGAGSGEPGQGY
jgi:hypothetical protein